MSPNQPVRKPSNSRSAAESRTASIGMSRLTARTKANSVRISAEKTVTNGSTIFFEIPSQPGFPLGLPRMPATICSVPPRGPSQLVRVASAGGSTFDAHHASVMSQRVSGWSTSPIRTLGIRTVTTGSGLS